MVDVDNTVYTLLQQRVHDETWGDLAKGMLELDFRVITQKEDSLRRFLSDRETHRALDKPYYLAVAETLRRRSLPPILLQNPLQLLTVTNLDRVKTVNQVLNHLDLYDPQAIERFLFEFLEPEDWRIFLNLRTTIGRVHGIMPPSLGDCLSSFTQIYEKRNAKPRRPGQRYQLTVGAKALSKHWHRDRNTQFWGVCTGTESEKNELAERVLIKILSDAVWVNLHSLPHNEPVYEVRQSQGYGLRWAYHDKMWVFRGFLEPQMEQGHAVGWVH